MKWLQHLVMVCALLPAVSVSAPTQSPQEMVKSTTEQMLKALRSNREVLSKDPSRIYELVSKIVLPHFDFESMARGVLGVYWRRASADQRHRFVEQFRHLLVRTYASSLAQYENQTVRYRPLRAGAEQSGEVTVRTEIEQKSGFPVPVDYDMQKKGDEWKVVGVTIDQLNLVTNYRSSFGVQIRQIGLDGLIKKLAARNQQGGS